MKNLASATSIILHPFSITPIVFTILTYETNLSEVNHFNYIITLLFSTIIPFITFLVLKKLKSVLEDPSIKKVGQNIKFDFLILSQNNIQINPLEDTMLISYSIGSGGIRHNLDALAKNYLSHNTMSFKEIASGAISAAEKGFIMHELMAQTIRDNEAQYRKWSSNREIYLPNNRPPKVGDLFVQADLAKTLKYMADQESASTGSRANKIDAARQAFYRGDIAHAIAKFHKENGGWITQTDLERFRVTIEPAIEVTRKGATLFTCGPWCQGVSLAQMWNLLKNSDLKDLGHNSADYIHIITEVIKLALSDREHYLGDPEFVDVPLKKLLSNDYGEERYSMIKEKSVLSDEYLWGNDATFGETDKFSLDTSYMCAVDKDGLVASITPSDGSANTPVLPGWGINPSSRGSQSWAIRNHPSSVFPWKRPRLTPNPAIAVLRDNSVMPFGTPGADVQTQAMLQVLLNIVDFNIPLQEAVELPRFASYDAPDLSLIHI